MSKLSLEEKAKWVRNICEKLNMTAYEIGNSTGLNVSGLQKFLRDTSVTPRNSTLNTIINYIEFKNPDTVIPENINYRTTLIPNRLNLEKIIQDLNLNDEDFAKLTGIAYTELEEYKKGKLIPINKVNHIRTIFEKLKQGDSTDLHNILQEPQSVYKSAQEKDIYIESLERIIQSKDEQIKVLQDSIAFLKSVIEKPKTL